MVRLVIGTQTSLYNSRSRAMSRAGEMSVALVVTMGGAEGYMRLMLLQRRGWTSCLRSGRVTVGTPTCRRPPSPSW
ncbi:hypothetical protein ONE63_004888 [Megalurothrips usitatus]|uniref:Uncharacterized protein n=1 Tax=Megalurothrips usitatus TaxID=439358 RepID=A0AAV7X6M2_9NEOP|nr:hypothetical protein ONE63_004888 [Megalurothrips usitatus]